MYRDPVDDGEHSRGGRIPPGHQGEPTPAYHRSASQPYQHHSPNTPAPLPLHHANLHPHQPLPSPNTTELPPISTALYSRDTSRYYDPTSDNGDRGLARDPARYDPQYSAQVRPCPRPSRTSPSPLPPPSPACAVHAPCPPYSRQGHAANLNPQQARDSHAYPDPRSAHSPYEKVHHSPVTTSYAHHSPLQRPISQHQHTGSMEAMSHSPVSPSVYQSMNRGAVQPPPPSYSRRTSVKDEVSESWFAEPPSTTTTLAHHHHHHNRHRSRRRARTPCRSRV